MSQLKGLIMRNILCCLTGFIALNIVFVASATTQSSDYNKPILVKSSKPTVTISLVGNKTTGYSWFLKSYDQDLVQPLKYKYVAPQNKMPGAPGESVWTFRIREFAFSVPQIIKIKMLYARPWDLTESPRTKVITIITQ